VMSTTAYGERYGDAKRMAASTSVCLDRTESPPVDEGWLASTSGGLLRAQATDDAIASGLKAPGVPHQLCIECSMK
jgi:hypothetical protein